MIYLDNAATSNPKPESVTTAVVDAMMNSANPGRAGHQLANNAARILFETRELVAELFGVEDSDNVVFTRNITESLNLSLKGILRPGDHVITSSMEHNSMMRPLNTLKENGIDLTVIPCDSETGLLRPDAVRSNIRENTKIIALNHVSNVCGTIQPIEEIGTIACESGVLFLVDTAQSAGIFDIDMSAMNIDLLAFTGHKGLLGPMGIGGLVIGDRVDLSEFRILNEGGTGSLSEDEIHPTFMPDFMESGTPNVPAIAGLGAGIKWILETGTQAIREQESALVAHLLSGLKSIPGVRIVGPGLPDSSGGAISILIDSVDNGEAGTILDREYGIACRIGLHCSPSAHKTLNTFPSGTIRFGVGHFNTTKEIEQTILAIRGIAERGNA